MTAGWILLDAHQMGARLLLGVPDKNGKGYHDRDARNIVASRVCPDGSVEAAVWGDDGLLVGARELESDDTKIIRLLDAGEETAKERVLRVGRKVGGAGLGVLT